MRIKMSSLVKISFKIQQTHGYVYAKEALRSYMKLASKSRNLEELEKLVREEASKLGEDRLADALLTLHKLYTEALGGRA